MVASDELLTIAELAIGLAAFSGVVVAFTYRGELRSGDRYRFIALFTQALSIVVLAFVPFCLHHAGLAAPALWQASSGVMLVFWVLAIWFLAIRRPDFAADERPPQWILATALGLSVLNLLLQLANLLAWPMDSGAFPYLAGLLIWLVVTASFFSALILYRPKE